MGDGMSQEYKMAASSVRLLEMKDFTAEHIKWLQAKLLQADNFIRDEGRKVLVDTQDGVDVIEIPPKENREDFIKAWLKVYNTCLATLDIDVKIICLKRKHVRKQYNQIIVGTFPPVQLPENTKSVEYIEALEKVISNYNKLLASLEKNVMPFKVEKHEVTLKPVEPEKAEKLEKAEVIDSSNEKNMEKPIIDEDEEVKEVIKGQKISDGEKLSKIDCSHLKEENNPFVLVTCTHLDKDENTFLSNAEMCEEMGIPIGAYINGKAKNPDGAIKDSKKILKLLNGINVVGPVVYEINLDYLRTHDSSDEIKEVIEAYNGVAGILTESGYHVLVATDLDTGVLLEREIKSDNIPSVYPMIYRIVPRELEQMPDNASYVLMDPQYDNDIVKIVNPNFKIENKTEITNTKVA